MIGAGVDRPAEAGKDRQIDQRRGDGEEDLKQPDLRQGDEPEHGPFGVEQARAMLPQTLQGAERPAEALIEQAPHRVGRFGVGARRGIELHAPAGPLEGEGQVLIFRQGVRGIAAQFSQGGAPPCADRAGHHRHRAQGGERAALQILRGHIFQRLPAGDQVEAITDNGVSGHRADLGVYKPTGQLGQGVGGKQGVGVKGDDDVALGLGEPPIERPRLAAVLERHQPDPGIGAERLIDDRRCPVG